MVITRVHYTDGATEARTCREEAHRCASTSLGASDTGKWTSTPSLPGNICKLFCQRCPPPGGGGLGLGQRNANSIWGRLFLRNLGGMEPGPRLVPMLTDPFLRRAAGGGWETRGGLLQLCVRLGECLQQQHPAGCNEDHLGLQACWQASLGRTALPSPATSGDFPAGGGQGAGPGNAPPQPSSRPPLHFCFIYERTCCQNPNELSILWSLIFPPRPCRRLTQGPVATGRRKEEREGILFNFFFNVSLISLCVSAPPLPQASSPLLAGGGVLGGGWLPPPQPPGAPLPLYVTRSLKLKIRRVL